MAEKINLKSPRVRKNKSQVATYGTQTPLSSTAVERGTTRWLSGSTVVIQGLLDVTGTATVGGTLSVTGTFNGSGVNNLDGTNNLSGDNNLTGPTEISGSLDVTGPTTLDGVLTINGDTSITGLLDVTGPTTLAGTLDIEGNTTVTGTLDIQGRTTIKNDLELLAGGIFKAGVTKIEPSGKATFGSFIIDPSSPRLIQAPGGWLFSNGADHMGIAGSLTSSVNLSGTGAVLDFKGESTVTARAGAIDLTAPLVKTSQNFEVAGTLKVTGQSEFLGQILARGIPTTSTSGFAPNLYVDSNGRIYRTTWTP